MSRLPVLLLIAAISLALSAGLAWLRSGDPGLPDFSQWPAGKERKAHFFGFLRPLLEAENERILTQRSRLERIAQSAGSGGIGYFDGRWLEKLAHEYAIDPQGMPPGDLVEALLLRVDAVPVSLGLAQAAKESGWGTSRFAAAGNALFGQRCFQAGCGIVPRARPDGGRHEVRSFPSPAAAVASYVHNLNTHPDYREMRQLRARLRARGERVTGFALAQTLGRYSERRQAYVQEIRQLIHHNGLGPVTGDL